MNSVGYWIELRENQMLSAKEATKLKVKNFKIHFWKNLLDKNKVKKVQYLIRSMGKIMIILFKISTLFTH